MVAQVLGEPLDVEPQVSRVADEVVEAQRVLVREQQVVQLPEGALIRRRLGGLGRQLAFACTSVSGRCRQT